MNVLRLLKLSITITWGLFLIAALFAVFYLLGSLALDLMSPMFDFLFGTSISERSYCPSIVSSIHCHGK